MFFPYRDPKVGQPVTPANFQWELVTGGDTLPIDLDTVKNFLNVPLEDTFFDSEKTTFIYIAQQAVEFYAQINVLEATWIGYLPRFFNDMRLLRRPFKEVTKIEYVEATTGIIKTLDPSLYIAGKAPQQTGVVSLGDGCEWPAAANRFDAVRVTVKSGWAANKVPDAIRHAMLLTVASLDHSRADDGAQGKAERSVYAMKNAQGTNVLPAEARALLAPYTYRSFMAAGAATGG